MKIQIVLLSLFLSIGALLEAEPSFAKPTTNSSNAHEQFAYKSSRSTIPCRNGTGTRRCITKRICQTFAKPNYSIRKCWYCQYNPHARSAYQSMRNIALTRHTCDPYVVGNLSGAGYNCLLMSSPRMKCKMQHSCRWICR